MKDHFLLTLCLLTALLSCGRQEGTVGDSQKQVDDSPQELDGMYEAQIIPVNTNVAGSTVGEFRIRIAGNELRMRGEIANSPPVPHRQHVHTGSNCPGPGADEDLDGTISYEESRKVTGELFFPMKDALPGAHGNYTSFIVGPLTDVMRQIPTNEELTLSGRTIMIYGAAGNPTLPVACGTIERD